MPNFLMIIKFLDISHLLEISNYNLEIYGLC